MSESSDSHFGPLELAKWQVAVLQEQSTPGVARFLAVRDSSNEVVDFLCTSASPTVARLFGELSGDVVGRRLTEMSAAEVELSDLLLAYLEVMENGSSVSYRSIRLRGEDAPLEHRIVRLGLDELGVVITESSAVERALVARDELQNMRAR